jgi:hypothetical protein
MRNKRKMPPQSRLRFMSSSPPTAAEVAAGNARWERRGPLRRLVRRRVASSGSPLDQPRTGAQPGAHEAQTRVAAQAG